MKFDRTFAHRHDDAGVATLDRRAADTAALAQFDFGAGSGSLAAFDRLSAGLAAQRTSRGFVRDTPQVAVVDEPTQELPRIVDFGAGRAGSAGVARVSVRVATHVTT